MATSPASTGAPPRAPVTLHTIHRACREHGIAESMFGRRAIRDPALVSDMRNGRELRPGTAARVAAFLASIGEVTS